MKASTKNYLKTEKGFEQAKKAISDGVCANSTYCTCVWFGDGQVHAEHAGPGNTISIAQVLTDCEDRLPPFSYDTDDATENEWVRSYLEEELEKVKIEDSDLSDGLLRHIVMLGRESLLEVGEESTAYRVLREEVVNRKLEEEVRAWTDMWLTQLMDENEDEENEEDGE